MLMNKWFFLLSVILISGCYSFLGIKEQIRYTVKIPHFVIAKADSIIISKTGNTFFLKYICYDSTRLTNNYEDIDMDHPQKYLMIFDNPKVPYSVLYKFIIPGKSWIDEPIRINFDSLGNIINPIPEEMLEYLSNPSNCIFGIDSAKAVVIARQDSLEEGLDPWRVTFGWGRAKIKKFTWVVTNCLKGGIDKCPANGKKIIIDANSGNILSEVKWECVI